MVMPAAAVALPLAAVATTAYAAYSALQQSGYFEQLGSRVQQGLGNLVNTFNEWISVDQQQAAQQQIIDQQALLLAAQAQFTGITEEAINRQFQQQLQEEQTKATQKAAVATATAAAMPPPVTAEDIRSQILETSLMTGLSPVEAETQANIAARAWEETQARAKEAEAEAEKAARKTVTTEAAKAGTTVTGVEEIALSTPLTAAGLASVAGILAKQFASSSHQQRISCMGTTGATMLTNILQAAVPSALAAGFMVSPQIQQGLTGIAAKALDILYKPLEDMAPITPEKGPAIGTNLLLQAVLLGSGAHLLSVTAEAAAPLKHMGLGYLSAFMADMAGFSRIAAAFQGMMIQWGLAQPMRYWALDKFRPMVPDPRLLIEMSLKREITDDQFNQGMAYAGYPDDWIETFHRYKWRDPRLFEVLWIADVTRPPTTPPPEAVEWLTRAGMEEWIGPDWWYAIKFAKAGYDPIDLPVLAKVTKRRTISTARTRRLFSTRQLYREGYIDEDFIRDQFKLLDEPAESAEHWVQAERLERQYNLLQDQKAIYLDQYAKDVISEHELRLALATMIVDPEFLEAEVTHAVLKKYKPVAKAVAKEQEEALRKVQTTYVQGYTDLFRKDRIDQDQYYEYLVTCGIDPELAHATVMREEARKLPKLVEGVEPEVAKVREQVQKKYITYYTDLFKKDYLTPEEFLESLLMANVDPDLARATVDSELAKKLPKF